jgi:hypothetical protein
MAQIYFKAKPKKLSSDNPDCRGKYLYPLNQLYPLLALKRNELLGESTLTIRLNFLKN